MENDNRKKSIKDVKLAPTKGVRRPGAARTAGNTTQLGQQSSFKRAAAPKQKNSAPRSGSSQQKNAKNSPSTLFKDEDLDMVVSARRSTASRLTEDDDVVIRKAPATATSKVSLRNRRSGSSRIKNTSSTPKVLIILLLLIAIVFISSFVSYTYLVDKYNNPVSLDSIVIDTESAVSFKIERGAGTSDIAKSLKEQNLIANETIYRFLSKFNGYDGNYKAGTYTLCKGLNYEEIMVILTSNPESVKITIPEGFTTRQIANRLEANGVCTAADFLKAVENQDVSSYPFITNHENRDYRLDGYLFPDTYEFDIDANPDTIIYKMLNRFNEVYKPDFYTKAEEIGLTQDQVIILASLVEKEAKLASERPMIAGVFMNRLHSSNLTKMQSCATIRYAYAKLYGTTLENVTVENTTIDDLYNTYKYDGLPPGPICNPGLDAIEAVLNYSHHDYYYFVARTDDSNAHIFSETYEQHVAAKGF